MWNQSKTPRLEETEQICLKHIVFFKNLAEVQSQNLPKHQEQFLRNILEGQNWQYLTNLLSYFNTEVTANGKSLLTADSDHFSFSLLALFGF